MNRKKQGLSWAARIRERLSRNIGNGGDRRESRRSAGEDGARHDVPHDNSVASEACHGVLKLVVTAKFATKSGTPITPPEQHELLRITLWHTDICHVDYLPVMPDADGQPPLA
ncbi:hypothetical protein VMT40_37310 [Nocardia sp. CDC160]|nr:hypothetical protein [Nocardia sp. CDC160]